MKTLMMGAVMMKSPGKLLCYVKFQNVFKHTFSETSTRGTSIQPARAGIIANVMHSLREVMSIINGITFGGYLNPRHYFNCKIICVYFDIRTY